MVDSNDADHLTESAEALQQVLNNENMNGVPLLVYATKTDLPNVAMTTIPQISEALGLEKLTNRDWHLQATSAILDEGICEGLDWLEKKFKKD